MMESENFTPEQSAAELLDKLYHWLFEVEKNSEDKETAYEIVFRHIQKDRLESTVTLIDEGDRLAAINTDLRQQNAVLKAEITRLCDLNSDVDISRRNEIEQAASVVLDYKKFALLFELVEKLNLDEKKWNWLSEPNAVFFGCSPLEMISTGEREAVESMIYWLISGDPS